MPQGLPEEPLPAWDKPQKEPLVEEPEESLQDFQEREEAAAAAKATVGAKAAVTGKKAVPGGARGGKRKRGQTGVDVQVTAPEPNRKLKQTTIAAQVKAQGPTTAACPICHKIMTRRQVEQHVELCLAMHASKEEATPITEEDEEDEEQASEDEAGTKASPTKEVIVLDPPTDEETDAEGEQPPEEAVVESVPEEEFSSEEEEEEEEEEELSSDEELDAMEAALRTSVESLVAVRAGEWGKTAGLAPKLQVDSFVDLDDDPALLRVVEQHRPSPSAYIVATTQLTQSQREQVAQAVTALGGTETRDIAEATHLVVPTDENGHARESRRMLEAVARGRWAVSLDWVLESLAQKEWAEEAPWEVSGIRQLSGAILKGAQQSRQRGGRLLREFSITFHGSFGRQGVPPQKWLEDLALAAGAQVEGMSPYDGRDEGSWYTQRVALCAQQVRTGQEDAVSSAHSPHSCLHCVRLLCCLFDFLLICR